MISISPWVPLRCLQPLQPPGALCGAAGRPLGRRSARLCGAATGGAFCTTASHNGSHGGSPGGVEKMGNLYVFYGYSMDIYGYLWRRIASAMSFRSYNPGRRNGATTRALQTLYNG